MAVGIGPCYEGQFPKPKLSDVKIMFFELVADDTCNRKFPGHSQSGTGRTRMCSVESYRGALVGTG
jgi:hypothetical protein